MQLRDNDKRDRTVKSLIAAFFAEHEARRWKPNTILGYRALRDRLVLPKLGNFDVSIITRGDISRLH